MSKFFRLPKLTLKQSDLEQLIPAPKTLAAIVALLVGTIVISFAAIFIKWSEAEISPNATVFNRLFITMIVLAGWRGSRLILSKLKERGNYHQANRQISAEIAPETSPNTSPETSAETTPTYTPKTIRLLAILGLCYLAFQCTWAWSLAQTGIAISTLLHNLTPVFTSLGAWLIFRKRFDRRFLLGMGLAIGGATVLGLRGSHVTAGHLAGDLAALVSALFYGAYLLVIERLRSVLSTTAILAWGSLVGVSVLLPVLLVTHDRLFPYSLNGWLAVIALAVVCHIVGQGLVVYSLSTLSANFVAVFLLLDPAFTAIEAWIIFSESLGLLSWMALAVALYGICLTLLSQPNRAKVSS